MTKTATLKKSEAKVTATKAGEGEGMVLNVYGRKYGSTLTNRGEERWYALTPCCEVRAINDKKGGGEAICGKCGIEVDPAHMTFARNYTSLKGLVSNFYAGRANIDNVWKKAVKAMEDEADNNGESGGPVTTKMKKVAKKVEAPKEPEVITFFTVRFPEDREFYRGDDGEYLYSTKDMLDCKRYKTAGGAKRAAVAMEDKYGYEAVAVQVFYCEENRRKNRVVTVK